MSRIIIILSVILSLSHTFSTPYIADIKNVLAIQKVLRWKNESSTDPRIAVNLMFVHFKTALVDGNFTEIPRFFGNSRDVNKLFRPWVDDLLPIVQNAPMYFKRISFSVGSCIPTRLNSLNTITCDVLIRYPFEAQIRQLKQIEAVQRANSTHNLYENGWKIVSINRRAEEKLAEKWWEDYQRNMRKMEEKRRKEVVVEEDPEDQEEEGNQVEQQWGTFY